MFRRDTWHRIIVANVPSAACATTAQWSVGATTDRRAVRVSGFQSLLFQARKNSETRHSGSCALKGEHPCFGEFGWANSPIHLPEPERDAWALAHGPAQTNNVVEAVPTVEARTLNFPESARKGIRRGKEEGRSMTEIQKREGCMADWVQYKNDPDGTKWEVLEPHNDNFYRCHNPDGRNEVRLPKSDYIPCTPPTRWVDVTMDVCNGAYSACKTFSGYRLRKVQVNFVGPDIPHGCRPGWAFIVEKEEPQ